VDEIREKGVLKKGYIITIEEYSGFGMVNVFVDGKVYHLDKLIMDEKFKLVMKDFLFRYKFGEDFTVKGILVDVYLYNDRISIDLNSVNVEEL